MKNLLALVLELSQEMKALKVFVQMEKRNISNGYSEKWIDGEQVLTMLKISKRNLQNLRDDGVLPYSRIHGKFYYKASDLNDLLANNHKKKIFHKGSQS